MIPLGTIFLGFLIFLAVGCVNTIFRWVTGKDLP
jgi:hypothetical protein